MLRAMLFILFASGLAGLGFQMVWAKMFALGLGHEISAVLAVVAAFFGGMAAGAWLLDARICRSKNPGVWYGGLELVAGLWGLATLVLIPAASPWAQRWIGSDPHPLWHWLVSFLVPFLILLPSTAAMGATFPAFEHWTAPLFAQRRGVGALYSANTAGALAGALGAAFLVMPRLGFVYSGMVFAGFNLASAAAAFLVLRRGPMANQPVELQEQREPSAGLKATVFATGFLGIGFEIVGIRVLSQVLENTAYTFAVALAVYLLAAALGAAAYHRWTRRGSDSEKSYDGSLAGLLTAIGVALVVAALPMLASPSIYSSLRNRFGDSLSAVFCAEFLVVALVLFAPAFFMGATFSHLLQHAKTPAGGLGRAAALNTLGGALAPAFFGVGLIPLVGTKWTLACLAVGHFALVRKFDRLRAILAAIACLFLLIPWDLVLLPLPPETKLIEIREGVMASVAVVEHSDKTRTLRVNSRFQMGGDAAFVAERRQAHLPLLLHPSPKRVLFLGVGTGITMAGANVYPDLKIEGVELIPEVVEMMPHFRPRNEMDSARARVYVADARRFTESTEGLYDVVVADLFHPARDGAGSLYTEEHFRAIRHRLAPGGLFCQWLPLHQLDSKLLSLVVRTFLAVYPEAEAFLLRFNIDVPVLGLIGRIDPAIYSPEEMVSRFEKPGLEEELTQLALTDPLRLLGCYLAGPAELRAWAGSGPINRDQFPIVTFEAPRFAYLRSVKPYETLDSILPKQTSLPPLNQRREPEFRERLAAFYRARGLYFHGLILEAQNQEDRAIESLLQSVRASSDFTSSYSHCVRRATLEARTNPARARFTLEQLAAAQPDQPLARQLLQRLFPL